LIVGVDGSGIKVSNRGEWMRQAWGIRRGWIKGVILGDSQGNIVDILNSKPDILFEKNDAQPLGFGKILS
jgi:hypothetical protein